MTAASIRDRLIASHHRRENVTEDGHDWLVFHRVRFASPLNGTGRPFPGPGRAEFFRFYPASPPGETGMRTNVSDEWGGFSLFRTREAAEDLFADPKRHLAFLEDSVEAWHALAVPFSHRGKVHWHGGARENSTFATAHSDPGGPLMVLTSAGYDDPGPADVPRIANFIREVDRVQAFYATLPGNIRRAVYSGAGVDGHDGMTVSIWRDDAAMLAAAYRPGHHRAQMDHQRDVGHFDRSSFTRTRIIASTGAWDGGDPVLEIA